MLSSLLDFNFSSLEWGAVSRVCCRGQSCAVGHVCHLDCKIDGAKSPKQSNIPKPSHMDKPVNFFGRHLLAVQSDFRSRQFKKRAKTSTAPIARMGQA